MVAIVRHERVHGIKLCHAKVGGVVGLISESGELKPERYIVCEVPDKRSRAAREMMTHGLYDSERAMFLLNVETGQVATLPHLSSRVALFPQASFTEGPSKVET